MKHNGRCPKAQEDVRKRKDGGRGVDEPHLEERILKYVGFTSVFFLSII